MNEADKKAYLEYLQKEHNFSPSDAEEYYKYAQGNSVKTPTAAQPEETGTLEKIGQGALTTADYAGRVLDYAGGLARGSIAGAAEPFVGKNLVDIQEVLKGKAPTFSEILEKSGVPEWYSLSTAFPEMYSETGEGLALQKGGMLDPSVRGAVGLGLDIATDPLTYGTLGLSALSKVGKAAKAAPVIETLLTPVGKMAGKRAEKIYKKAFETVDTNIKPLNKPYSISDILSKEKFKGNLMEATDKVKSINEATGQEIGDILKQASQKGATVDMMKEFEPALSYAQELRKMPTPEAAKLADDIDSRVMYAWEKSGGVMPVDKANELKTFINKQIKESGFAAGDEAALSTQARKAIASDVSEGVKNAVQQSDKELAKKLAEKNKLYSSTSSEVQDALFQQAKTVKERRKGLFGTDLSSLDLVLAGVGAQSGGVAWAPLLAKKAGEVARSTTGRTNRAAFGKFLEEQKNIVDPVLRQALWVDMLKQEGQ
jgi:hypothetical protein